MNKALRKARRDAGLSRAQLEAGARLVKGSIYDIEAGRSKTPAYDTAVRILRVLKAHGVDQKALDRIFPVGELVEIGK